MGGLGVCHHWTAGRVAVAGAYVEFSVFPGHT
jgi:hypothetical protein